MIKSFLPEINCACKARIPAGALFCKFCHRSRGPNQYLQFKLWELFFVSGVLISCFSASLVSIAFLVTLFHVEVIPTPVVAVPQETRVVTASLEPPVRDTPDNSISPPKADIPTIAVISATATISCAADLTQASLRRSPGYLAKNDAKDIVYKIDCGQTVTLLGKKQKVDGLTWWKISWNGYTGWMADHTGSGRVILVFDQ